MADISVAVGLVREAANGADVRKGIADAMEAVNGDNALILTAVKDVDLAAIQTAANTVTTKTAETLAAAATATTKAGEAAASATSAATTASGVSASVATATTKAGEAAASASTASTKANEATTAATTATTKAGEAAASASTASTKANEATTAATTATAKSSEATASAISAAESATSAETSAADLETAKNTAVTASQNAAASETAATTAATTATTKAGEASTSATDATTAAATATTKANEASVSAITSSDSATAASTSATNAASAANTASTKASDAAKSASDAAASAEQAGEIAGLTPAKMSYWDAKQESLGFTPENIANKGVANGYAGLGDDGKVPSAQLPTFDSHTHANKDTLDKITTTGTETSYDLHLFGDMKTTTYDTNQNGVVDNAEKVNGKTVLTDVPTGAVFTDTITTINGKTGVIAKTDITALGLAATEDIATAVANLVNSSPESLNTLKELADALGDDPNFATNINAAIANKLNSSAYTAADVLSKLLTVDGAGSGLDSATVNGKTVLTDVPTGAVFTDTITTINGKTGVIAKTDITALGIPAQDTTYVNATTSVAGLQSSTDKAKLDGISTNAKNTTVTDYSATITTTWTGSAPYSQTITVTGILASDKPVVDMVPTGTYATDIAMLTDWSNIYRIVTSADAITVYSKAATTAAIPINLRVVRQVN